MRNNMDNDNNPLSANFNLSEDYLYHLAFFDTLTGLPNRHKLIVDLEAMEAESPDSNLSIFLLDIDRFHSINELYGRSLGDKILTALSDRLSEKVKNKHTIYYNGEDEIYIIMKDLSTADIVKKAEAIHDAVSNPFMIDRISIYITVSIGISQMPETASDTDEALQQAETAVFAAKTAGKNRYHIYSQADADSFMRRNTLELDLQKAVINNELYLVYQPKIILSTQKIYSVEALLRWNHPTLGLISPSEFIPIAEESGAIIDIGYWVIEESIRQAKEWEESGKDLSVAVNISVRQLSDSQLVDNILATLDKHQLSNCKFIVEITETKTNDMGIMDSFIKELRQNEIRVAIDDFGTGYSTFDYLKNLEVNTVKIDRSFINDVPHSAKGSTLVKNLIQVGKDLNIEVVAEGIETMEQNEFLIENDCDYGQGYFYSKPVKPAELIQYLEDNNL